MISLQVSIVYGLSTLVALTMAESSHSAEFSHSAESSHSAEEEGGGEEEAAFAVLFPSFTITLGVVAFYVLSRYAKALPYTAVMFLLGTIMGITAELGSFNDHVGKSIRLWIDINSEVILLVFLPGLLFRDAMSQNVYLFFYAINQLLIFAFPLVLAGTFLTALVAYYIFPYGWPFNLAMTFGSILAATDPVAVAALLEEVGAPPRLKTHIAGESLLNDGAAIVFFSIFSQKYFFQDLAGIGIGVHGEDIDLKKGFEMFFQKSLGGVAVGLLFGIGQLMLLHYLNRRVNREENIVQVASLVAMAYLNFYTADFVWKTSGVISTVTTGLVIKVFGRAAINDFKLLEDFTSLLEYLLNTVLFTLGGVVWGAVVATGEKNGSWEGRDWGYLVILYVMLHVIRGLLFFVTYPVTARIGLKTNAKETFFQIYGGLRGALGIALAIALDNEVSVIAGGSSDTTAELFTTQVFAMIGGIAFLTLVVNGITAGPLLRKLGLAKSTETRKKIVHTYKVRLRAESIDDFVMLLTQPRFHHTNFALIKQHVPFLQDLTRDQLLEANNKYREHHSSSYSPPPFLGNILPYLPKEDEEQPNDDQILADYNSYCQKLKAEERAKNRRSYRIRMHSSNIRAMIRGEPFSAKELRHLFVSILRAQYDKQILRGELQNENLLAIALDQSLDLTAAAIDNGEHLQDWNFLVKLHDPLVVIRNRFSSKRRLLFCFKRMRSRALLRNKTQVEHLFIERSMAFMSAHEEAQKLFLLELQEADRSLNDAAKIVILESSNQVKLAQDALKMFDSKVVELVSSNKLCKIIIYMAIHHVEKLVTSGLLKESEAEHFLEELEVNLDDIFAHEELDHSSPDVESIDDTKSLYPQRNVLLNQHTSVLEMSYISKSDDGQK